MPHLFLLILIKRLGPVGGFGWLFTLDAGAPHTLKITEMEVMPDTPLVISIPYPLGTSFDIRAKAGCSKSDCITSCEEIFTRVNYVEQVRYSEGNVYHFDDVTGLLSIRAIMFPSFYTGEPNWKLYNFNDTGRNGEYSLFRFERNGVLLPKKSYSSAYILISADCTQNGAYCADSAPITSSYDNVCSPGFDQMSYDRCCDSLGNCEELWTSAPTGSPTLTASPTAYDQEIIENGKFDYSVCPWSPSSCTLTAESGVMSVTQRQNTWSGPRLDLTSQIHIGSTYNFQGEIKFLNADPENNIAVKLQVLYADGGSASYSTVVWNSNIPNNAWTTLNGIFELSLSKLRNTDVKTYILYIETPPRGGVSYTWDFMVDNITMVEQFD